MVLMAFWSTSEYPMMASEYRTALCGVVNSGCSEAAPVRASKLESTKANEGKEEAGYPNISQRQQQAWEDIRRAARR